jgi:hypothetical protein
LLTAPELMDELAKQHPHLRALVVSGSEAEPHIATHAMRLL